MVLHGRAGEGRVQAAPLALVQPMLERHLRESGQNLSGRTWHCARCRRCGWWNSSF